MTEAAEGVEPKVALAGEASARTANGSATNRLSDPDWTDWCDADR